MAAKAKRTTKSKTVSVPQPELAEEHRVFSHIMYILFLVAVAIAAFYTFTFFFEPALSGPEFLPVKSLVMLGWAFIFKMFGHRIHNPHH